MPGTVCRLECGCELRHRNFKLSSVARLMRANAPYFTRIRLRHRGEQALRCFRSVAERRWLSGEESFLLAGANDAPL
jgi:hypothetical protein